MARTANRSSSRRRSSAPVRDRAQETSDIQEALAQLLRVGPDAGWVVSCYQKLEPGDRAGKKYRIKLKNRLRRASERLAVLGFSHAERAAVGDALARVERFFDQSTNLSGGRGVAVFVAEDLFLVVKLPYVLRSRILVDRTAVVSELVALTEAGTRMLVAVADRRSARLFAVDVNGVSELTGLVSPEATRGRRFHPASDRQGAGEYRFHTRIREEKQRHLATVADAAARAWRTGGFDGVVVGGVGVDAAALVPHLSSELQGRLLGVIRLAPKQATPAGIRDAALELLADAADAAGAEAVGEIAGLKGSGWATDGIEPTLAALANGQVRTLVVDHDAEVPGYRFPKSGRLATSPSGTRGDGEAEPVADLLDDAMEEALRQRARVAVVVGPMAGRIDRMAGVLRFRMAK